MSQPFLFGSINLPEDMEHEMKDDAQQDLISVRLNSLDRLAIIETDHVVFDFEN
jgi:hypothetical protein